MDRILCSAHRLSTGTAVPKLVSRLSNLCEMVEFETLFCYEHDY